MEAEKKKIFIDALNIYFKMKNDYEETNLKLRKKIIKEKGLSWKEKRTEYKKLKPKCVNCKRPVGSIFSNFYSPEENGRKLMAVCGDRMDPCPLNIIINLGDTTTYLNDSYSLEKEIISLKNRIIKDKNDQIFGYISLEDAVKNFEDVKEDLNFTLSNYELVLENYMNVSDNKQKNDSIKKEQISIYQDIQGIKDYILQYKSGENVQFIRDAVEIYVNQLTPKIENLNKLKFSYRDIVYDSDDDTYHFVQKQYTIDELETSYSKHEIGVESLQIGVKETKAKPKPKPKQPLLNVTNLPVKPIQEKIIMQIGDEDEDEDEHEDEEEIPVAVPKEVDVLFADGNGETYLFKAIKAGDFEQVKAQIENGADVHKKTIRGETPLYGAVDVGNLEIVKYLLENGAESDINVQTNWGFTPLREATNKDYLEIAEVLKNNGGK
jgi:hypothetical protein